MGRPQPAAPTLTRAQTPLDAENSTIPSGGGFHEIPIEDKKIREQIFLRAEKDMNLRVKNTTHTPISRDHHNITGNDDFSEFNGDFTTPSATVPAVPNIKPPIEKTATSCFSGFLKRKTILKTEMIKLTHS